jgi:hypothetical protein
MTLIAHVAGAPVEELIPMVAGLGTALLLARAWLASRLRRGVQAAVAAATSSRGRSRAGNQHDRSLT